MKTLVFALVAVALSSAGAHAADNLYFDGKGNFAGMSSYGNGNTIYFNGQGDYAGSSTSTGDGE